MQIHLPFAVGTCTLVINVAIVCSPARAGLEEGVAAYEAGNVPLAIKEFRGAAEKGDADCQYNLALMYEQGIGVAKDEKAAVVWYRKAAELGNSNAQFNLGVLYEKDLLKPLDQHLMGTPAKPAAPLKQAEPTPP